MQQNWTAMPKKSLYKAAQRLVLVAGEVGALFGLKGHFCICDFGDGGEEEDNGKQREKTLRCRGMSIEL